MSNVCSVAEGTTVIVTSRALCGRNISFYFIIDFDI